VPLDTAAAPLRRGCLARRMLLVAVPRECRSHDPKPSFSEEACGPQRCGPLGHMDRRCSGGVEVVQPPVKATPLLRSW
jgi:hypothetical protein